MSIPPSETPTLAEEQDPPKETPEELEARKKLQFDERCEALKTRIEQKANFKYNSAKQKEGLDTALEASDHQGEVSYAVARSTEGGWDGGADGSGAYHEEKAVQLLERVNWPVILVIAFTSKQLEMLEFSLLNFKKRVVSITGMDLKDYYSEQITKESKAYVEDATFESTIAPPAGPDSETLGRPGSAGGSVVAGSSKVSQGSSGELSVSHQYDVALFSKMWRAVIKEALGTGRFAANVEVAVTSGEAFIPLVDWLNINILKNTARAWNALETSPWRRDKFLMQKQLEDVANTAGGSDSKVQWARSEIARNRAEVETAIQSFGEISATNRVVIKPTLGAGSEHLEVCESNHALRGTCERLLGQVTKQFTSVQALCIQEYLEGDEFVVDVVSLRNRHIVTDVWLSVKNVVEPYKEHVDNLVSLDDMAGVPKKSEEELQAAGRLEPQIDFRMLGVKTILYRQQELLPHCRLIPEPDENGNLVPLTPRERKAAIAVKYAIQVIESLDLTHGPSHVEIIVQPDNTPKLVELNPRLQGDIPRSGEMVGFDQISLLSYLLSKPEPTPFPRKRGQPGEGTKKALHSDDGPAEDAAELIWPPRPFGMLPGVRGKPFQTTEVPSLIYEDSSMISWYDIRQHGACAPPTKAELLDLSKYPTVTVGGIGTHNNNEHNLAFLHHGYHTTHERFILETNKLEAKSHFTPTLEMDTLRIHEPVDKVVWVHYLTSFHLESGLINDNVRHRIRKLPTFTRYTRCSLDVPPGKGSLYRVKRTVDLLAAPGAVVLEGRRDAVRRDVNFIRDCERCTYNPEYNEGRHDVERFLEEARSAGEEEIDEGIVEEMMPQRFIFLPHLLPDPEHDEKVSTDLSRQMGVAPLFADNTTIHRLKRGPNANDRFWGRDNLLQREPEREKEVEEQRKLIERLKLVQKEGLPIETLGLKS